MRAILEVLLSLLAVWGLLCLGWLGFGHLLTPAGRGRVCAVIPGQGDGDDLEQTVDGLLWLRAGGLLSGAVVIADCGLTPAGRQLAEALCRREPAVALRDRSDLSDYIDRWTEQGQTPF